METPLTIAKTASNLPITLLPQMANRHGLITGATGTGKTVTLQKMAECFSQIGVPVFMADVKGDLSGISQPNTLTEKLKAHLDAIHVTDWQPLSSPTEFWDVYQQQGIPVRATISDMGPLLLARLLHLNDVQAGVLQLIFKIADDRGLLLLDLKDLQTMVKFVGENNKTFISDYGNITSASIGAIQRGLLTLGEQGGNIFFGEPMLDIHDLMRLDDKENGMINILAANKLYNSPILYSTFLLWLLSELFEQLPEVGDIAKPKLIFFFDEAHLLFNDAPTALLEKIEQVIRLIRSKGVGIFFVTQSPLDIPNTILGQLGNRVQHALRAFTPQDQKAVKVAAQTMRANPQFNAEQAISDLGTGEALISFLNEKGQPSIVERAYIIAPGSRMGSLDDNERQKIINNSQLYKRYADVVDQRSAYETLTQQQQTADTKAAPTSGGGLIGTLETFLFGSSNAQHKKSEGIIQNIANAMKRQISNQVGRSLARGLLGNLLKGRKH